MDKHLVRERDTVSKMIALYCREHHDPQKAQLCDNCQSLLDYATQRIERCTFGAQKPTCARCTVHCYHSEKRKEIRRVMRFSGPRMLFRHPFLALMHLLDGLRPPPDRRQPP